MEYGAGLGEGGGEGVGLTHLSKTQAKKRQTLYYLTL